MLRVREGFFDRRIIFFGLKHPKRPLVQEKPGKPRQVLVGGSLAIACVDRLPVGGDGGFQALHIGLGTAVSSVAGAWSAVGAQAVAAMTKPQRAIAAAGTFIGHLRAGGTVCCYFIVSSVGKAAGGVYSSPTYGRLPYEDEIRSVEGPDGGKGGPREVSRHEG